MTYFKIKIPAYKQNSKSTECGHGENVRKSSEINIACVFESKNNTGKLKKQIHIQFASLHPFLTVQATSMLTASLTDT